MAVGGAVSRYRIASEANDIDGIMQTLAPDVAVVSPISGRMVFRGHDDVRVLLTAVYSSLSALRWREEAGAGTVHVVVGDARVADDGRIRRIRPHLRPWLALTLLALKLGPTIARRPGLVRRALRRT